MATKQQRPSNRIPTSLVKGGIHAQISPARTKDSSKKVERRTTWDEEGFAKIMAIRHAEELHAKLRELFTETAVARAKDLLFASSHFVTLSVGSARTCNVPEKLRVGLDAVADNRSRILMVLWKAVAFGESIPDLGGGLSKSLASEFFDRYLVRLGERVEALRELQELVRHSSVLPLLGEELRALEDHRKELYGKTLSSAIDLVAAFLKTQIDIGASFDAAQYPDFPADIGGPIIEDGSSKEGVPPRYEDVRRAVQAKSGLDNHEKSEIKDGITTALLKKDTSSPERKEPLPVQRENALNAGTFLLEGQPRSVEFLVSAIKDRIDATTLSADGVKGIVSEGVTYELRVVTTDLRSELAELVAAGRPPGGICYFEREKRNETALEFFDRVYGRFYKAGILYKDMLRAMDRKLVKSLGALGSEEPSLPTKRERTEREVTNIAELSPRMGGVVARKFNVE